MTKLLFLAGSARKDSLNKKLASAAAKMAEDKGAHVTLIDLKDYEMPLYDGDLEADKGLSEAAIRLKKLFEEHDGFFIASPEYNGSFSALLKNTLDWISRPHEENETSLIAYNGKVAALGAASPGGLGGIRGLVPLRMLLGNINVHVVPSQVAIAGAFDAFDNEGKLQHEMQQKMLSATIDQLIQTASALR